MKRYISLVWMSALLLGSALSCEDARESDIPTDVVGFSLTEPAEVSVYDGGFKFAVLKSGKGGSAADVYVDVATAHSLEEAGSGYAMVPASVFSGNFDSKLHFGAADFAKPVSLEWNVAAMSAAVAAIPLERTPVIALEISASTIDVSDRTLAVVKLIGSKLSFASDNITGSVDVKKVARPSTLRFTLSLDNAIKARDLEVSLETDASLVAAYNAANGTDYETAPAGLLSLPSEPVRILAGTKSVNVPLVLDNSVLFASGKPSSFSGYVVPIRIRSVSIEGVGVDDSVLYAVLLPSQRSGVLERLWGRFSTSAYWFEGMLSGMSADEDRNIAIDTRYLYIARASASGKGVYVVDLEDPSKVQTANMTGVSGGYFETSCVRTIPNQATGESVLLLSSMGMDAGDMVMLYAYPDGFASAPKAILNSYSIPSWAPRRFGDMFTVYGDWASGEIWMRSMSSCTTASWNIVNGELNSQTPAGWGDLNKESVEMGAIYRYNRESKYVFYVSPTYAGFWNLNGDESVEVPWGSKVDYSRCFGFKVFSFDEKNYVAYVQVDADRSGGSLVILKDNYGTPDKFAQVLEDGEVAWKFPIQDESDESVRSPKRSTQMMGGCDVAVTENSLYIAAHIQGVGLSVFKMNK